MLRAHCALRIAVHRLHGPHVHSLVDGCEGADVVQLGDVGDRREAQRLLLGFLRHADLRRLYVLAVVRRAIVLRARADHDRERASQSAPAG